MTDSRMIMKLIMVMTMMVMMMAMVMVIVVVMVLSDRSVFLSIADRHHHDQVRLETATHAAANDGELLQRIRSARPGSIPPNKKGTA